ncbi:MAG TPA: chloride channel protein [Gaiellaceae bacterium]|nr:chloride channel protein [Gaiellaceae bacterium]
MSEHDETLDLRLPEDSIGGADERSGASGERRLADFAVTARSLRIVLLALVVGALSAGVALALLDLIGLFTHLAYYGRPGRTLVQPSLHRFGAWTVAIPVLGGLLVGLMARFGSERIRGHGIPEAMETILIGGSKVEPRLTVLKPISSAISIGSGGPFGAEGPIILTGGAVGSVFAQLLHLTAAERRALLVAGACGGMAAVFGTPVAAVLFGVELLVFEWRPRSLVPIAASVAVAGTLREEFARHGLVTAAPLFPVSEHVALVPSVAAEAVLVGVAGGLLAWLLTVAVYGAEDAFKHVPLHWSWWPALGGLVVGLGGLVDPRALGVGYGTIADELAGRLALGALVLLLVVKLVIWAAALGSGTSGGILAPLLIMGAAVGGMLGHGFGSAAGSWAVLGMAATLAGVTRSPFTSIVFAVELTHEQSLLLPLLIACASAHMLSVLALRRSILTEKVARRGFHVTREYVVDPLEAMFVREVMQAGVVPDAVDGVVAYPDEVLRTVATRMAEHRVDTLPVVARGDGEVVGTVTVFDLLAARRRQLLEDRHRERPLPLLPLLRRSVLSRR